MLTDSGSDKEQTKAITLVNSEISVRSQPTFTCSKSTMKTKEQCTKSVQSYQ